MDEIREKINTMLVSTFHELLELEEKAIITDEFKDISNNDMHIIEAIGNTSESRMTDIAKKLNITVGSLTTSMNSLVKKGYVERSRNENDRRVVNVRLLDKGMAAFEHHRKFHEDMTEALISCLTTEELNIWMKSLDALTNFFHAQKCKPSV
ncbi:MAG: MarR family transcriptional regulator [Clostridiales bacterium]|nr:MarR family transcriptional regulator [Clostridiales bacterium]